MMTLVDNISIVWLICWRHVLRCSVMVLTLTRRAETLTAQSLEKKREEKKGEGKGDLDSSVVKGAKLATKPNKYRMHVQR